MQMVTRTAKATLLAACLCALAACSKEADTAPDAAAPAAGSTPAAAEPAAEKTNAALTADQVKVDLVSSAEPAYLAADDTVVFQLKLSNKGGVVLPATGANPVTVGVIQFAPGKDGKADERGTELRAPLTGDLQPGSAQDVVAVVPAAFVVDKKVQFEGLQEGVAWFGYNFSQPVVVLGPFARCADGKAVCDAAGKPLAAK